MNVPTARWELPALRPWLTALGVCLLLLGLSTLPTPGNGHAVDDGAPGSIAAQTERANETGDDPTPVCVLPLLELLSDRPQQPPVEPRGAASLRPERWDSRPRAPPASIRPA